MNAVTDHSESRRAVVIGAGMAGLAAAGALAEHVEQVVVLERDALSSEAVSRTGAPQGRHVHGLLAGGLRALDELFPGFEQDLAQAGAVPLRAGLDFRYERPDIGPMPQRDFGWMTYAMSRPLIEFVLRRRVTQLANVTLRPGSHACEIAATPDGRVSAVALETASGGREKLAADLVVDASGRGALSLDLIAAVGRPAPEETIIGIDVGYATAVVVIPDGTLPNCKGVVSYAKPSDSSRMGIILPMEGGRSIVTLGGRGDDWPPGNWDGFLGYAQQLTTATIYNAIRRTRPLGDIARFGTPGSVWRHFDRLEPFPRGLLPIGDAICRFNPIYGQGMSVAAQEACLLRRLLRTRVARGEPLAELGKVFLAETQALIDGPWRMSAIPDFVFPQTRGERPADLESALAFSAALNRLAARDPAVHKLVVEVHHLLKPQSLLRDSDLVRRVTTEQVAA
jgi:2-polyprenyl-6-methoxyphenol hydroxylase-like FAD-dependent oxidoreductase